MGEMCVNCKKEIMPKSNDSDSTDKVEYPIVCSDCGKDATVPFAPKAGWSTYCRDCYAKRRR